MLGRLRWIDGMEGHYFILVRLKREKWPDREGECRKGGELADESMPGPSSWKGHATLWAVPGLE